MYALTWLWVVLASRCLGSKLRRPNHWGRGTTSVRHLCQCCQVLWWDPFRLSDSSSFHSSHLCPLFFFLAPPLQLFSSPHLPCLPSKQRQVIRDAAAAPFFYFCSFHCSLFFIHFTFLKKTYTVPLPPLSPSSVHWFEYMLLFSIHYFFFIICAYSFLRMMNTFMSVRATFDDTYNLCKPASPSLLSCSSTNILCTKSKGDCADMWFCILNYCKQHLHMSFSSR